MAKAKKLPSGNWRVQVSSGEKDERGRYKYISITAPTQKEAELAALEYQVKSKEVARNPANMTLAEAMESYIESKSNVLSPSTIRSYYAIHRNNLKPIKQLKLSKLSNNIIQSAINNESLHRSPKTIRNIHGLLTAVLNMYMPDFRLNTRLPQSEKKIKTVLSDEQLAALIKAVEGTEIEIPVLLALWLGLRQSEICGLTWSCVDFKGRIITIKQAKIKDKSNNLVVKTTKTYSSTRILKVPSLILTKLLSAPKDSEFITNLSGSIIYHRFKKLISDCGLPEITFHDLRMMNASVMLKLNIPDKYAMERGGWNNVGTMKKVYQQLFDAEREAVDGLVDNYFESLLSHRLSHEK